MVRNVLIAALVLLGVLVVVVMLQPSELRVVRSAHVAAPPEVVFDQLDDFVAWQRWSPWQDLDPQMQKEVGGPESGVGAWYTWSGNEDVGQGRMEILSATAPERVVWDLQFLSPWEARNTTTIEIDPDGEGSTVRWTMTGPQAFMAKAAGLFMDMDAMIGADFERGLGRLDAVARDEAAKRKEAAEAAEAMRQAEEAAELEAPQAAADGEAMQEEVDAAE
ncbi:MAG: SRPBCC family protein [Alphaproteobacteria bacterium]|nr:SRPBCC family protein [Alphaproteobacteria bacterium]